VKKFAVVFRWAGAAVAVALAFVAGLALMFVATAQPAHADDHPDSLQVFIGRSVRILDNSRGQAWGVSRMMDYGSVNLDFGYLNEGTMQATADSPIRSKRDGIFIAWRPTRPWGHGLSTYFEIGPYVTGTTTTKDNRSSVEYRTTAIGGFGIEQKIGPASIGARWVHVIGVGPTGSADVFTINLGVWK
jgi:hypothetical protein